MPRCCLRILVLVLIVSLVAGTGVSGTPPLPAAGTGQIYGTADGAIVRMNDVTGAGLALLQPTGTWTTRFLHPSGIFVDRAGRIYVADGINHRIVRMNDMTGAGWTVLDTCQPIPCSTLSPFNPTGIFVDRAGRIYVTDTRNSRIVRVDDMTGTGWTTLGSEGNGIGQFVDPFGIFVDREGRIYVSEPGRIVRMRDMTGADWTTLGTPGTDVNQFWYPQGILLDTFGRIYVSDTVDLGGRSRIVRFDDMTGRGWATLDQAGGLSLFGSAGRISVDGMGRIYVADYRRTRIVRVNNMRGDGWTTLGTPGSGVKQFSEMYGPTAIFVDRAGRIYVADPGNKRLVRMSNMTGDGWTTLDICRVPLECTDANQFAASGIFVDAARRVYVADSGHDRILQVGAPLTILGTTGSGVDQFHDPEGIFKDGAGRIYVADTGNNRIVRMSDMRGTGWTTLGTWGRGVAQFDGPTGLFVDGAGRIYVVDTGNGRIVRINDMTAAGWTALGSEGSGDHQFSSPHGIFVESEGWINVADSGNGRVVRVRDMTGAGWSAIGQRYIIPQPHPGIDCPPPTDYRAPSDPCAPSFSHPYGIFVDGGGRMYVADADYGIVRVSRTTDEMHGEWWMIFPLSTGRGVGPRGIFVR